MKKGEGHQSTSFASNLLFKYLFLNSKRVTHTFRYLPGVCPRSYGTSVAAMAGISEKVVDLATKRAQAFEKQMEDHPYFAAINKYVVLSISET